MLWQLLQFLFYGIVLAGLLFAILIVYKLIILPLRYRIAFQRYPNVYVTPRYIPMKGDIGMVLQGLNEEHGNFFWSFEKQVQANKNYDLVLMSVGPLQLIVPSSMQAVNEMLEKVPHIIDRSTFERYPLGQQMPSSYPFLKSSKDHSHRRKATSDLLGLNFASRKIPLILRTADKEISKLEPG